jgi:cob(I)alamin adenosyltransferase
MKIYTGSGDKGKTSLFSGERISKGHFRVAAYGDVDELTSILGGVAAHLPDRQDQLKREIRAIQSRLMQVAARLAATAPADTRDHIGRVNGEAAQDLEKAIDRMEAALPELRAFILPGGDPSAVWAHLARTVCRRTERGVVRLQESLSKSTGEAFHPEMIYLNRLSDYLFVLARYCNHITGTEETAWRK